MKVLPLNRSPVSGAGLALRIWLCLLFVGLAAPLARAAEVMPPVPDRYFNDYAGVIARPLVEELNTRLETFEKTTSSQILVAIYPKMQSDSSVQDYTVRIAQAWKVGQKDKRNGAVLFLFVQDRKMFLQVGYGLEGAIPDATAKQITEFEIKPRLRNGDYNAGLRAGVEAILKAAQGEYKGTGSTVNQRRGRKQSFPVLIAAIFILFFLASLRGRRNGRVYHSGGWGGWGGGFGGGGGWSGGGGGGGGGFSSGGGSFGGGGAGSDW